MILRRLLELSYRLPDLPPSGYQPAFITKIIRLKADGTLRDVIPATGEKRGKREGLTVLAPRETPQRTSADTPRLICDNANYVLGRQREKDTPARTAERHRAFVELVGRCADATGEPTVNAIRTWLSAGGASDLRTSPVIEDDDELMFEVDGIRPVDLPAVQRFWAGYVGDYRQGRCLVTGKEGPIVDRMPFPIKGIPYGQTSGTALVSVNNPAGCSYGLEAALNSPIGADTAERASNALNYLLGSDRHAMRIGKSVFVYWTRTDSAFDLWDLLGKPSADQVGHLIRSARLGLRSAQLDPNDFYVLSLSANVSRVVVRDYQETTLQRVQYALGTWFDRLAIVGQSGGRAEPVGLFRLSVALYREPKDVPAHVPISLMRCAITGAPLPNYLLGLAVKRNQAMQGPYDETNGKRYLSEPRLALIKAIITQKEDTPLEALNPSHPDPAYHCGRLLATLERIQRAALGDINATVVDRYYGAACASPGSILGGLVNDAQAHLGKLRKEKRDYYHQLQLEEILSAIGPEFPRTLSLHRQGLFALGFYHQKAHDRAQAAAAKAAKEGASA
ncbi:MAG: type I-C CRISPR-associated protein Cas8c/Csd1 [Chthonomonadales bacterium]|nr:type I-C CRISPR-associated protein Cas8c/Csd1 [Chthonomonadales bacterium]